MAREPQRRDEPRHLDAAIVPVERALTARAKAIEAECEADDGPELIGLPAVAREFRLLAAELHHW